MRQCILCDDFGLHDCPGGIYVRQESGEDARGGVFVVFEAPVAVSPGRVDAEMFRDSDLSPHKDRRERGGTTQ